MPVVGKRLALVQVACSPHNKWMRDDPGAPRETVTHGSLRDRARSGFVASSRGSGGFISTRTVNATPRVAPVVRRMIPAYDCKTHVYWRKQIFEPPPRHRRQYATL